MISEALKSWLEADAFRREEAQSDKEPVRKLDPLSPEHYTDNLLAHGIIDWRRVE